MGVALPEVADGVVSQVARLCLKEAAPFVARWSALRGMRPAETEVRVVLARRRVMVVNCILGSKVEEEDGVNW